MRVRTASDLVYTLIARAPFILLAIGSAYLLFNGLHALESISFGSEFLVGNDATTNLPAGTGPSDEQILLDALSSGDVATMEKALNEVESRHAQPAAAAAG